MNNTEYNKAPYSELTKYLGGIIFKFAPRRRILLMRSLHFARDQLGSIVLFLKTKVSLI
jgi:hypothetical protein